MTGNAYNVVSGNRCAIKKLADWCDCDTLVDTKYTWTETCVGLNHRKIMKTDPSRLIPRKLAENLKLVIIFL